MVKAFCAWLGALLLGLKGLAGETATAVATTTAGYVTGITVTSGGSGYADAPAVTLVGSGGTGAQARAVLSGDRVSEILVVSAGRGYLSATEVVIGPPSVLIKSRIPQLLVEGPAHARPALQVSLNPAGRFGWKPWITVDLSTGAGEFVDLSAEEAGTYYRLMVPPGQVGVSARAIATVRIGLVSKIAVTEVGLGYVEAPQVTVTGGGGTGASALALVNAGKVTDIVVISAGQGYVSAPLVEIAPPSALRLGIAAVTKIQLSGTAGASNQIQYLPAPAAAPAWRFLTNVAMGPGGSAVVDRSDAAFQRLYRSVPLGAPAGGPAGFVWIDPGEFQMGSPLTDPERFGGENLHTVMLTQGFWLGDHETTQAEYEAVTGINPSYFKGKERPVEQVSWYDAVEYCRKLTELERAAGRITAQQAYRLPREAEWEYAARAGTTGPRYGEMDAIGWYQANAGGETHPVMLKQPNAWGLYDMLGNVMEWCSDWRGGDLVGVETDPAGPVSGSSRVLRGGAYEFGARYCRASIRTSYAPGTRSLDFGFRPALSSVQ